MTVRLRLWDVISCRSVALRRLRGRIITPLKETAQRALNVAINTFCHAHQVRQGDWMQQGPHTDDLCLRHTELTETMALSRCNSTSRIDCRSPCTHFEVLKRQLADGHWEPTTIEVQIQLSFHGLTRSLTIAKDSFSSLMTIRLHVWDLLSIFQSNGLKTIPRDELHVAVEETLKPPTFNTSATHIALAQVIGHTSSHTLTLLGRVTHYQINRDSATFNHLVLRVDRNDCRRRQWSL